MTDEEYDKTLEEFRKSINFTEDSWVVIYDFRFTSGPDIGKIIPVYYWAKTKREIKDFIYILNDMNKEHGTPVYEDYRIVPPSTEGSNND